MELFREDGCLSDEGLHALTAGQLDELGRLEAAEHLAYCDKCTDRYTALLTADALGDLVYRWGHSSPVFRALYLVMDSLPDVVVCVVLIVCGVWLVKGPHPAKKPDASKDVPEDADFCEYHADEPDNAALLSSPVVNENEVTDDGTEHDE